MTRALLIAAILALPGAAHASVRHSTYAPPPVSDETVAAICEAYADETTLFTDTTGDAEYDFNYSDCVEGVRWVEGVTSALRVTP